MKKRIIPILLAAVALCGCKNINVSKLKKVTIPTRTLVDGLTDTEGQILAQRADKKLQEQLSKAKSVYQSYEVGKAVDYETRYEIKGETTLYSNGVSVEKGTETRILKDGRFKQSSVEKSETITVKQNSGALVQNTLKRDKNPEERYYYVDDEDDLFSVSTESLLEDFVDDFDLERQIGRSSNKKLHFLFYGEEVTVSAITMDQLGVTRTIAYAIMDFKGTLEDPTLTHFEFGTYKLTDFDEAGKVHKKEEVVAATRHSVDFEYKGRSEYKDRSSFVESYPSTIINSARLGVQPVGGNRERSLSPKANADHFYGSVPVDVFFDSDMDYEVILSTGWSSVDKNEGTITQSGKTSTNLSQQFVTALGKGVYDAEKGSFSFEEETPAAFICQVDYENFGNPVNPDNGPTVTATFQ